MTSLQQVCMNSGKHRVIKIWLVSATNNNFTYSFCMDWMDGKQHWCYKTWYFWQKQRAHSKTKQSMYYIEEPEHNFSN